MRLPVLVAVALALSSCAEKKPHVKTPVPLYVPFTAEFKRSLVEKEPEVVLEEKGFSAVVLTKDWEYETNAMIAGFSGRGATADLLLVHKKKGAQIALGGLPWAAGTPALIALHNSDAIMGKAGIVSLFRTDGAGNYASFVYKTSTQSGKVVVMRGKDYPEVSIVIFGGWSHKDNDEMLKEMDRLIASIKTFKPKK